MKWLIARRLVQGLFLALFLTGPWFGVWITKGTLASSLTFDTLPLTDPFMLLQSLVAGHAPETAALVGAVLVLAAYAALGGRLYCSWVCPINIVTDAAAWTRQRLGLKGGLKLDRRMRFVVLAAVLLASAGSGVIVWELVNPITLTHRALVFGGWGAVAALAVFLFDTVVVLRGWCSHLCPVGAFYGFVGRFGLVKVAAPQRARCDGCGDCYRVCPEPHVITPALKGPGSLVIRAADCTACGRCIDVCPRSVFAYARQPSRRAEAVTPLRQGD
ncbi:MAG TPA: quinol dehydrogenase ferredoxin subunit NapH [Azospirillaceae bacterium]|nr:quinol dehydrogenase ferredoxin subunit NapH [Azospirillaceae bacterium]